MRGEYIDFIAEYCDRWCERCPFTSRCSSYAVRIATEMCDGDLGAGIELAVGAPPPRDETERLEREAVLEHVGNYDPTDQELKQAEREDEERDERIHEIPVSTRSQAVAMLVHRWLEDHGDRVSTRADATVTEAIGIAARHGFFIHVKLLRALDGRDRAMRGEELDDHPIQNDWNGSAKVALISIVSSINAWHVIIAATDSAEASYISEELVHLQREVEAEFPDAWRFVRPGFDQS